MSRSAGDASSAPPDGDLAIRIRGVRKRFGYREVLRGVDLDVAHGECVAMFGPNGAGKSTLLRILSTLWKPTSGSGSVLGRDIRRDAVSIRAGLGVVFHDSFLRRELTLSENLSIARELYGVEDRTIGDRMSERVGLFARRHDRVATYSQGMLRRASIARSLLNDPRLWLLDEPFSGLDPGGRDLLEDLIRDAVGAGKTVLLVTHRHDLGHRIAARSLVVEDGVLREEGSS